jgi:3-dehydroquinate synthase
MSTPVDAFRTFFRTYAPRVLDAFDVRTAVDATLGGPAFAPLLLSLVEAPVFAADFGAAFAAAGAHDAIAPCRMLRSALSLPLQQVFGLLGQVAAAFGEPAAPWYAVVDRLRAEPDLAGIRLARYLVAHVPDPALNAYYDALVERLIVAQPHAIYPTSPYRQCDGRVESSTDHRSVEAVMSVQTFASIRMIDRVLDPAQPALRDVYGPLGRCVCVVDRDVHALYGDEIADYFAAHGIALELLVYRATEADKGLATVERMLGDFKRLGVARNEPVLIVGGGVLADTGGLACALYGRNTPYVMVATSIVSGIDAGPSPRTCCDGFGYKNLLGAYHPPVLCITDRFFFGTLHAGWLRHGVAEIIKIATVTNAELFADLEAAKADLIPTRFGTVGCEDGDAIEARSTKILSGAMRSYIESEYDNLYETHQCRPHAYGHTWSPGFEIEAGLLHGHAVAIDMGFGAYLSLQKGWIDRLAFDRIMGLISAYGLSLWHEILDDEAIMWECHRKIVQKRGGNLVAPLPRDRIGACGYLNELSRAEYFDALARYRAICAAYPRAGRGIEPLCSDVGLDMPSATGASEVRESAPV